MVDGPARLSSFFILSLTSDSCCFRSSTSRASVRTICRRSVTLIDGMLPPASPPLAGDSERRKGFGSGCHAWSSCSTSAICFRNAGRQGAFVPTSIRFCGDKTGSSPIRCHARSATPPEELRRAGRRFLNPAVQNAGDGNHRKAGGRMQTRQTMINSRIFILLTLSTTGTPHVWRAGGIWHTIAPPRHRPAAVYLSKNSTGERSDPSADRLRGISDPKRALSGREDRIDQ